MTGRFCNMRSLTLALAITLCMSPASAQPAAHSLEHAPLPLSNNIGFAEALDQALSIAPEDLLSQSADDQASTAQSVAERWIVGAPSWQSSVVDDQLLSDRGLRELQTGVAVNVWRPGERQDARVRGSAYQQRSTAMQNYLQWLVAGRVRSNLAALELADLQVTAAEQAHQDALQLLETTRQLQNAGEVSMLDVLQAESLWLQKGAAVLEANAALVDAERVWQVLTGLSMRPASTHQELRSTQEEIAADHPLLALRRSEITISQSNIAEAERNARGSPNISFGVRRERGDWQQRYIDSVGVSVSIPITSRAAVAAGSSDARAASVHTELAQLQDLRELTAQLHEAEHELFTLAQALPLTERQVQVDQQQWQMAQTAFAAGETDLTHVIMAMQRAQNSVREHQQQLLRQQHLNSEYNQIIGVLP